MAKLQRRLACQWLQRNGGSGRNPGLGSLHPV